MIRARILLGASVLCAAATARGGAQIPDVAPVPIGYVIEKLGVKTLPNAPRELELGKSTTTILAEPKKLIPYGIDGMHEGARVTITCIGPSRLQIEADELEPVAQRAKVTVKVDEKGTPTPVPAPQPATKPPLG